MLRKLMTCLAAVFAVATTVHALDAEGLIAAYTFDEGAGATAEDISGNGYDGVITDGAWVDGPFGMAAEFTGGQSHMAADGVYTSLPNNAISLSAWFYLTNHTTYEGVIGGSQSGRGNGPNDCCQYRIMVNPGSNPFFNAGGHTDVTVAGFTVDEDQWYHYAMTIGDNAVTIYMDGEVIHEDVAASDPLPELDNPLLVGTGESAGTWPLTGYVDEVVVYNRAISEDEVNDLMNDGIVQALSVDAQGKAAVRWADLKRVR